MAQRKALGRGLSALLGTPTPETQSILKSFGKSISIGSFPTRNNHESTSTKRPLMNWPTPSVPMGLIQPIVVQPLPDNFFRADRRVSGAGELPKGLA